MKTITIPRLPPIEERLGGRFDVCVVKVNWFPRLTVNQVLANALAAMARVKQPYPDPNLIEVRIER